MAANQGILPATLWGSQASVTIKFLIGDIVQTSRLMERQLSDVEVNPENQPCSRFKKATESITCKQRSTSIQTLYDHSKILSDLIDELWISANTALDLRHGLLATETKPAGSEQLLLFRLCSKQTEDCNLDMDLHDYATSPSYCFVTEPSSQEIR